MSDTHGPGEDRDRTAGAPRPEPIRFFGTTWVGHNGGYALRRVGVAVGSLVSAVIGALVLLFGFQGLTDADVGLFVNVLAIAGFAVCSVLMFVRTWRGYVRIRPSAAGADPDTGGSMQGLYVIGFVGALLAYFVRSLYEAPGERLLRAEYEQAREQYERRRAQRTGNPAGRGKVRGAAKRRR
ncbi:hypothetical protein [Streptomyces sp. NBC_00448]|uniref:hypothetical protein n=1 Tax=Streptomyces sp. NBC_00448 TaxID=2903652 RepID=UPI002E1CDF7D